jgi:hypothetical protein
MPWQKFWMKFGPVSNPPVLAMSPPRIPSRITLGNIFNDEKACRDYLVYKGIIAMTKVCACGDILQYNETDLWSAFLHALDEVAYE